MACVSGRSGTEAARLVGVEGMRYVGNHGLELHPDAGRAETEVAEFRDLIGSRWPVEDKGLSLSFHFRETEDEDAARATLETIAAEAVASGLDPRWGRKVLEVRPAIDADKGTAVAELLRSSGARRAAYAGDDATDLDAFRALDRAPLDAGVRIAVDSAEAPEGLLAAADAVAASTDELAAVLGELATS